jgi:hypothetical protein
MPAFDYVLPDADIVPFCMSLTQLECVSPPAPCNTLELTEDLALTYCFVIDSVLLYANEGVKQPRASPH